ncbi:MAG: hypothetical protein K9J12_10855 [Melioribacteraceae bacterium]|nr:hypothetical protein [Melioribacteraceae bacterium]MCF8264311.1 hypothetical protein [Melioribacteraceae bacterium]MCF8431422.1 hypothetical protein [Melioribacteraceae bacterium]
MSTLPPPSVRKHPENSIESKIYSIVEGFETNIPIQNDRYRLSYCLYKFIQGEGDNPEILVNSTKIKIEGISKQELAKSLNEKISGLSKN